MLLFWPSSDLRDFLIAVAVLRPEFAIERQVAAIEPGADRDHRSLGDARLFDRRRRQFEAQHVAAAVEIAAVENQAAVAVEDAGAGLGRRNQPPQHRRDAFRIDRKIQSGIFVRRAIGFAGLQIEQPVGIDGDGVGLDGGGGRDRAGDDLGLHQQALRPRVDQAGAELREIKNARHQRDQAGEIERNDAAGQAGEAEREEELTGPAQPAERPLPAFRSGVLGGSAIRNEGRQGVLGIQAWIRLRSIKQWPKLPVVSITSCDARCLLILPQTGGGVS